MQVKILRPFPACGAQLAKTRVGKPQRFMLGFLRKLFFWNYARNTWQWDVLCAVILVFIFLTPKSWFENSERPGSQMHQTPIASTVIVDAQLVANAEDKAQLAAAVRKLTNRQNIEVLGSRPVTGLDGKTVGYEVDIR